MDVIFIKYVISYNFRKNYRLLTQLYLKLDKDSLHPVSLNLILVLNFKFIFLVKNINQIYTILIVIFLISFGKQKFT